MTSALILTWCVGYERAVELAREVELEGSDPWIIMLSTQDMPSQELSAQLNRWPMLHVSSKFNNSSDMFELVKACKKAYGQYQEGLFK